MTILLPPPERDEMYIRSGIAMTPMERYFAVGAERRWHWFLLIDNLPDAMRISTFVYAVRRIGAGRTYGGVKYLHAYELIATDEDSWQRCALAFDEHLLDKWGDAIEEALKEKE